MLLSHAATPTIYQLTDGTTIQRRFPGDPNPRVSGKAYWGASQLENTTVKTRFEDPTGTSMSLVRRFWSGWGQRDSLPTQAKADISANRLPMYSIKPVGWTEMASGSHDAEIDGLLRGLDSAGGPVWLIVHHEPDGGGSKLGPRGEDDPGGASAWVAMQKKIRSRMSAVGTKNVALMAAMTGGWGSDLNQPKDNWWADGVFDAWFIDHYKATLDTSIASKADWAQFSVWADNKKIPYGTAELGLRSGNAEGVGYYLPTSDCSQLVPRGVSASNDQLAGDRLREFWNWGFVNKKDVIAHAYFDQCQNSGDSPYALGGRQLDVFREILKQGTTSGKVQRVKDLGTPTTAPTTTINPTTTITPTTTINPTTTITPLPTASLNIVGLAAGASVTSSINVEAHVVNAVNFQQVDFYIDDQLAKKETVAKYCIGGGDITCLDYSIANLAAGPHTLKVVLSYGNAQTITKTVSFTKLQVSSADTTPPTAPTNIKASLVYDALSLSYGVSLSWSASSDSGSGVRDYLVRRNGTNLGTATTTSFKDSNIVANTVYSYEIFAYDKAGNISSALSPARLVGRCFLIWCWAE